MPPTTTSLRGYLLFLSLMIAIIGVQLIAASKDSSTRNAAARGGASTTTTERDATTDKTDRRASPLASVLLPQEESALEEERIYVRKRDGRSELLDSDKILERLTALSEGLDERYLNLTALC